MAYYVSADSINVEYLLSQEESSYSDSHFKLNVVKGTTKQKANLVSSEVIDGVRKLTYQVMLDKGDGVYSCEGTRNLVDNADSNTNFNTVKIGSFNIRKITLSSDIVIG